MTYLLDTNVCIRYLNGRSSAIKIRMQRTPRDAIRLCSVVRAELKYGAEKSQFRERTLAELDRFLDGFESLPFDDHAADQYARIRAVLEREGTPIGPNDLLIAAIAVAQRVTLVTNNSREFARVPDLRWQDWEADGQLN